MITGTYDYRLVALSVVIAIAASYAALNLGGRVTAARRWMRLAWLGGGALSMGLGIWSMHYVGMEAYRMPIPVRYDIPTVLASLVAAVSASAVALFVVSRARMNWPRAVAGSIVMGLGIAGMHYTGMAAMRMAATTHYDAGLVALSVVLAIVISLVALGLTFRLRGETRRNRWEKAASALVMGCAIPVMHYTGMAAASFTPSGAAPGVAHAASGGPLGTAAITLVSMVVLGLAVATSAVDRRLQHDKLAAAERRRRRVTAQYAIALALAESASLLEATPRILPAVCEILGWEFGAVWMVDQEVCQLRCVGTWHGTEDTLSEFDRLSRQTRFAAGVGLPGRVWASPTGFPT